MSKLQGCGIRRMHIFNSNNHNKIMMKKIIVIWSTFLLLQEEVQKESTKDGLG